MHRTDVIKGAARETAVAIETSTLGLHTLEQYAPLIGAAATERIFRKAEALRTLHVVHISSTFYGGGVTEVLMLAIFVEARVKERLGSRSFRSEQEASPRFSNSRRDALDLSNTTHLL